jgi:inner membrane protein
MRFAVLGKALSLGAVLLGLVVGLSSVQGIVAERIAYQEQARQSIRDGLAGEQVLAGPAIHSACVESWTEPVGEGRRRRLEARTREFSAVAFPAQLALEGRADIEPRYRGLFKLNTFAAATTLRAQWTAAQLTATPEHEGSTITCKPVLAIAVSDARGVRRAAVSVQQGSATAAPLAVKAGSTLEVWPSGLHAALAPITLPVAEPLAATIELELLGSDRWAFVPLGDATTATLASNWPHPSFTGAFLPSARTVGAHGFSAQWDVSALATGAQQQWRAGAALCAAWRADAAAQAAAPKGCLDRFDVAFIDPVNPYSLADRATKYGLLFVALTFVGVGLFELLQRLRVHPMQYLLVGAALVVFFLLLLSLSEHLAFAVAYAAAAGACVALLAFYASHVLHGWRRGLPFALAIATLYGVLYVLLQLEQTALLVGSVLLFAVLALVMTATRKLDWYALFADIRCDGGVAANPAATPQ